MPEVENNPPPGIVSTETNEVSYASVPRDIAPTPSDASADQAGFVDATLVGVPQGV